jgi:copper chaperone NosL
MTRIAVLLVLSVIVNGCYEETVAEKPDPVTLTAESVGYYCQMDMLEHEGPKAQIHIAGYPAPLWFSQVRDAVAYTRLPEETTEITAIYVNDMGRAKSWADPGADNWVDADAIPFGAQGDAETFITRNGGTIVRFAEIPEDYVLSPVDTVSAVDTNAPAR